MIAYIEKLLKGQPVEWKTLGEMGTFMRGFGIQKKDLIDEGIPAIHYGQIYTYYNRVAHITKSFVDPSFVRTARKAQTGDIVIATTSENDTDVCKAVAWLGEEGLVVSNDACFYRHSLNPMYLAFFFESNIFQDQKRRLITGTKVRRVNPKHLAEILIPVPPLSIQQEIADILRHFTELEERLATELKIELEARRKQYEYYRNSLLSFDKPGGGVK